MTSALPAKRPLLLLVTLAALAGTLAGCQLPQATPGAGPTQADRLMQAYPELRGGRFAVIADFEDPRQLSLFRCFAPNVGAQYTLDRQRGRQATGTCCLLFTAGGPEDAILIANQEANEWFLPRDWRAYDLLLLSLHTEQPEVEVELTVAAGAGAQRIEAQTPIPLDPGWNLVRLDLAELGEHVPLDNVRELRLSIRTPSFPAQVWLDDWLLTGRRADLLGDPRNLQGQLYLQQVGKRWHVGAGGRFELTFGNGQLVRWLDLSSDPSRLHNLVQGTTLGPNVVMRAASGDPAEAPSPVPPVAGVRTTGRQEILELSPVRVVIACTHRPRFAPDPEQDPPSTVHHRYTIYPTGQVYVDVETTLPDPRSPAGVPGLAVTLAGTKDYTLYGSSLEQPVERTPGTELLYAWARGAQPDDPLLLFAVDDTEAGCALHPRTLEDGGGAELIALGPAGTTHWRCQLWLAQANAASDPELRTRARTYLQPPALRFQVGRPATSSEAGRELDPTGFDAGAGCYVLKPARGCLRFTLGGDRVPVFSPAFRVLDQGQRTAWVYVNDRVWTTVARDRAGNLIFQLPGTVAEEVRVEVLFDTPRPEPPPPAPSA